jgi:hypothetical protein
MKSKRILLHVTFLVTVTGASAQETPAPAASAEELAKKLSNPVASLISVPFQNNTDYGIGDANGSKNTLNIQPVIPISISAKLNLITRYIFPVISQYDVLGEGTCQNGLSDATISAFFSPKEGAITWGVGPAFLVPVATDELLGTEKFGVGPTALVLKQSQGWTYGALLNQLWSVAGNEDRADVSQLFMQPFLVHNWKSGAGLGGNMELTQNWEAEADALTGYFNPFVSGVTKLGKQTVSIIFGPRVPVAGADVVRPVWGWRAALVLVFPK